MIGALPLWNVLFWIETSIVRIGEHRVRVWVSACLLVLIGLAAYRIGLYLWGSYHRRAVDAALARRDFAQAQDALARCLWLWPDRSELRLLAAQTARRQRNVSVATRQLRLCQADSSLKEAVGLEQCLLQIQSGDLANSEQLDQYCRSFPNSQEAMLIEEAQIVGSLAALDVARARSYLEDWNQRRKSPADRVQGLLWKATACLLANEVEQAAGCFREAVELNPASREARLGLAQVLTHSDPTEAARQLQVLRQAHPADADVLYAHAVVDRNLGQLEAAAGTVDELLTLVPEHVEGLVLRGYVALDQQRIEEAGEWFRRAEKVEPKHRAILLALVEYLRLAGKTDEAQRYVQRMQEIQAEVTTHVEAVLNERGRASAAAAKAPTLLGPAPP